FTYETLRYAAQGVAEYLKDRTPTPLAVVGDDCRFASEFFAEEGARGLAGNRVRPLLFARAAPAPGASWAGIDCEAQAAAVVTASHNPYQFNGLKYKPETGSAAPPEVIAELERRIGELPVRGADAVRRASPDDPLIQRHDPKPAYFAQIRRMVDLEAMTR